MGAEGGAERERALQELRVHGLRGAQVHLLDAIPLLEVVWADGALGEEELRAVEAFVERHIAHLNALPGGPRLQPEDGQRFLARFTQRRPAPGLLRALRALVPRVILAAAADPAEAARRRATIIRACVGAALASSPEATHAGLDALGPDEEACLRDILSELGTAH
jgi:hypothetical protein